MNLLVCDGELFKKCNSIWDKINNLFKKEFDSEPVYNEKHIIAKINLYNVNFCRNKKPKANNESYPCFSIILLDSTVNRMKIKIVF